MKPINWFEGRDLGLRRVKRVRNDYRAQLEALKAAVLAAEAAGLRLVIEETVKE